MNNKIIFRMLKEMSNPTKFKIIEITQENPKNISEISKATKVAYNKCSNYCTQLAKINIVEKSRQGKKVFIKSKIKFNLLKKMLFERKSPK